MFENKVSRRIFGPRRDEVTGEWRRLHNEELNDLRRIFGPRRDEVTGEWRRLHNEELNDLRRIFGPFEGRGNGGMEEIA